jgi:multimeric flavodoxin WrbA
MPKLNEKQERLCEESQADYSDLRAMFINCALKRSPEVSNTQGLMDISMGIMRRNEVEVECIRAVDHDIATGVWPDMTEHGWERDEWPQIFERVMAADILVLGMSIWLGEKSSVATSIVERLYGNSHLLNDDGQYAYYGKVGGCLVTGQRGRRQALRDERPLFAPAPGLTWRACSRTPAASRRTATSAPSGTQAAASTSRIPSTAPELGG